MDYKAWEKKAQKNHKRNEKFLEEMEAFDNGTYYDMF